MTGQIEQIEAAIVSRLKERLPGYVLRIEGAGGRPDALDFPAGEQAAVFVRYAGSEYGPQDPSPRAAYASAESMTFQVVYLVRALLSSDGAAVSACQLKDEIRRALHGRSIHGATPLVPLRNWLDDENSGVWRWIMEFGLSVPAIAEFPDYPLERA